MELLLSSTIGLMLMLLLAGSYGALSGTASHVDETRRAAAAGQQALEIIVAHARLAGMPQVFPRTSRASTASTATWAVEASDALAADETTRGPPIFGCERGIPEREQAGRCRAVMHDSDGVVFRYAADPVATWPSKDNWPTDCLGQNVTGDTIAVRFYVQTRTPDQPELYCRGNGHDVTAQPLVDGIEQLRLSYWLAGAHAAVRASSLSEPDWRRIVAIDVCVVSRGPVTTRPTAYLDCDGNRVMPADRRVRTAWMRRVAIRNAVAGGT
ncbi:PilW family protein [Mycetohabitans sp. B8]|uniref:PilW family protein n=1 Tax=Mycetohabitans sp. B8 TaxID=2841845 RepID=UPI001F398C08|nr:PilW family protein [Mycetohabitans sp. B8]MCG1042686.1 PilW family protein [Mycetohabitans sp. B8]